MRSRRIDAGSPFDERRIASHLAARVGRREYSSEVRPRAGCFPGALRLGDADFIRRASGVYPSFAHGGTMERTTSARAKLGENR